MIRRELELQADHDYLAHHAARFDFVERLAQRLCPSRASAVLDIGRSELSYRLAAHYDRVVTLGFPLSNSFQHETRSAHSREPDDHVVFDLNQSGEAEIPTAERFDLILFAEVIEHLHTAPELSLHALAQVMKPSGYLICQTPNAATITNRRQLLMGRNPFERIRFHSTNPGHFREYTREELVQMGNVAGLKTVEHHFVNYFPLGRLAWLKSLFAVVPTFRQGQTIVYQRSS